MRLRKSSKKGIGFEEWSSKHRYSSLMDLTCSLNNVLCNDFSSRSIAANEFRFSLLNMTERTFITNNNINFFSDKFVCSNWRSTPMPSMSIDQRSYWLACSYSHRKSRRIRILCPRIRNCGVQRSWYSLQMLLQRRSNT